MVAKITMPNNIRRALNYNEQKMKEGVAKCIYAHNFLKDAHQLNFYEKLKRFEDLIVLNKRASTNTVHISLNFGINENIHQNRLTEIAAIYMQKIGFGEQPYLVYQHLDTGHPHIHIVTTNIQQDGKRISLHNLGKNQSAQARKEIEITYGLVKAEGQKNYQPMALPVQRISYGKVATKRAITNVLDAVLSTYKYSSLAELNAILGLYNLIADRGKEERLIFKKRGLVYRLLDAKGKKIGVPIKASSIYNKPTLSFLEKKFAENQSRKVGHKKSLKTSIDWILMKPPKNLQAFGQALERDKIQLVLRQNEQGFVYGLTFIDHNTKCVFNGSDVGKEYSAKAILEKCGILQSAATKKVPMDVKNSELKSANSHQVQNEAKRHDESKILDTVIMPTEEPNYIPYELRQKRKRKKKLK